VTIDSLELLDGRSFASIVGRTATCTFPHSLSQTIPEVVKGSKKYQNEIKYDPE